MIPSGWNVVEAQEVCKSISVGVVIKPSQYYVKEEEGVKAFRSANVREGFINDNDWVYFSYEGHSKNKKSHLRTGDVLIVRTGYPGTACVVTSKYENSNAIDIIIARPNCEKVIPEYLCVYTNSNIGKSQVLNLQGGMAQKHLNVGAYQELKIKLPPLQEQQKIAKILSTWDKAISTTERLIENSKQQKKALMQQLLTGKKRLLDDSGKPFKIEWDETTLSQWLIEYKEKSTIQNQHRIFTSSKSGLIPQDKYFENSRISDRNNIGFHIILPGYMTYRSRSDDGFFTFNKFNEEDKGIISHYYPVFNSKGINTFFIELFKHFSSIFGKYSVGTSQKVLSFNALKSISFKIPKIEEQIKIAQVLTNADQEIDSLEQQLSHLKQEKKALMQQLLTGKRRV